MFSERYKRYVLMSSTLICALAFLDSALIGLLLQPIKLDLDLSDTQLGLLTGVPFGIFYATLGLLMARWADRGNRTNIMSLSLGLWAIAVTACLLITNFAQLMVARIAAAVGDAGVRPAAYSLLGDYFPEPAERVRAMGFFWAAGPLTALISYSAGGWLNEHYGWRTTFFIMGAPGILAALLIKFTVREPRTWVENTQVSQKPMTPMAEILSTLWRRQSTRHLFVATILLQMMSVGLSPWIASFMIRSHNMGTGELGVWMGAIFGIGGLAGSLLGGYLSQRWFPENERGQMQLCALLLGSLVLWFGLFLLLPHRYYALIALLPWMVAFSFILAPTYALLQRLMPDEMRASSLAMLMLFGNLVGAGLGPLLVGALSDLLAPYLGDESLRYAMIATSLLSLWSAYHFWQISRSIAKDLRATGAVSGPGVRALKAGEA